MTARLLERNLARLEELDQLRPADAEKISRLLSSEPLVNRNDRDCLPLCHRDYNVSQNLEYLGRQQETLVIGARDCRWCFSSSQEREQTVEWFFRGKNRVFEGGCGHNGNALSQALMVEQFERITSKRSRAQ